MSNLVHSVSRLMSNSAFERGVYSLFSGVIPDASEFCSGSLAGEGDSAVEGREAAPFLALLSCSVDLRR